MVTKQSPQEEKVIPIAQVRFDSGEIDAAVAVLRSGNVRQGKVTRELEERFAAMVGARHAVAVSSGTAALHLAWLALLEPGDEVLVPAFTFIATASTVVFAGGRPIFCDVDPATATLDLEDAARRLTPRTRAIAPVHLYGGACDVDGIQRLAREHGLRIVWDAAQAHGTRIDGRDVGSFADMVCYSFYPTKNMTTGEGGMITTNDDALAERLRLLRSHGQERKYEHTLLGLNYRLTDVQAAIGLVQLDQLPGWLEQRRANARRLDALLAGLPGITTPVRLPGVEHSYHQYTIQIDAAAAGITRDDLQAALAARGIQSAVHYPRPLHRQPVFAPEHGATSLPVSERLAESVLSLPVHPALTEDDLERIGASVRSIVLGEA
ncbi:DegT/DnrJ/EryC1/StrS aminotransferase family protein [Sphaerobacter sp.]|uniref:DegT/DnrJ/EryC1/StrS family aminotransferase n=1 Tax=Sphaerobacter sp. TaxID=2099654 RepID=UPI001E187AD8|nr:DegT/DnrJ/EryC1/StrS family aminotransferase [Sphaerobacter sp.]MBX5444176.1 DegT/DnrJ/EryC1/StrS family aminotransferase [Sphaerobacter sp.]